jgi:hypothetical protein
MVGRNEDPISLTAIGMMKLSDQILDNICLFLDQYVLVNICQCCTRLNKIGNNKLKRNLLVTSPVSNQKLINWNILRTFFYDYTVIDYKIFQFLYVKGVFNGKTKNIAMMKDIMEQTFYNPNSREYDNCIPNLPLELLITLDSILESHIRNSKLKITTFNELTQDANNGNMNLSDSVDLANSFSMLQVQDGGKENQLYKLGLNCQNQLTTQIFNKLNQFTKLKCLYLFNLRPIQGCELAKLSLNQFLYRGEINIINLPINWQTLYELRMEIDSFEVLTSKWAHQFKSLQLLYIIDQTDISTIKLYQFLDNLPNTVKSIEIRNLNLDASYKNTDEKVLIELIIEKQTNLIKFEFQSGLKGVEDLLQFQHKPIFSNRSTPYFTKVVDNVYDPKPDKEIPKKTKSKPDRFASTKPSNSRGNPATFFKITTVGASDSGSPFDFEKKKRKKNIFQKLRQKFQA